jgi:hypothetical protein
MRKSLLAILLLLPILDGAAQKPFEGTCGEARGELI